jgi:UDP-N-acetyl-D-glucosamine 4,6-dehydratase
VTFLKPTALKRILFFLFADFILSLFTLLVSYGLRFNFEIPEEFISPFFPIFLLLFALKVIFFSYFHIYMIAWRFFSLEDAKKLLLAHLWSYGLFVLVMLQYFELFSPFPRSVVGIDFVLSLFFIGLLRIAKRSYLEQSDRPLTKPTLIIGVNTKATQLIKSALHGEFSYFPSAIMAYRSESKNTIHTYINNVKVFALEELEEVIKKFNIEAAILTLDLEPHELNSIYERLYAAGVQELRYYRLLEDKREKIEPISITDLLARHPKDLDPALIAAFIKDKKVLITGAGGSIGSEIARQCQRFGAASLLLLDHAEFNLYTIKEELPLAEARLLSVANTEELRSVFEAFKPQIVIHAAAYKHVPLCEENVQSALKNNILGTMNVVDLSIAYGAQKLVIISTDKAVRPTNVMGATKRVTELYAQNIDSKETEIVAVRFGNVLGSSGSVIPKFRQQIEQGGPVTVTHPEMTRYFMLIPEACQLVLQAAAIAKGNELFILDMGEPVKIVDLARKMIQLYGKEGEVTISFSGLRPGEKLYEELMLDESEQKTSYESIFVSRPTLYDIQRLKNDIKELFAAENKIAALQKIVPEFERRKEPERL